jgi:hypothetical protein
MDLLELRKKSLTVLLVSFMALGMAACSSSGDSDDSASDDSASGPTEAQCDIDRMQPGCEDYKPDT